MKKTKDEKIHKSSIGVVETKYFTFADTGGEFKFENGKTLGPVTLAYETYGLLNTEKSNAILILHAFSGDAHAAGVHENINDTGWWDEMIGPRQGIRHEQIFYYLLECDRRLQGVNRAVFHQSENRKALRAGIPFYHCGRYG